MARTARQIVALGVTMVFAIAAGNERSVLKGLGQAEASTSSTARGFSRRRHLAVMGAPAEPATARPRVPSLWLTCSRSSRRGTPTLS